MIISVIFSLSVISLNFNFIKDLLNYKFEEEERIFLVNYLQSLQDPETGLFFADKKHSYTDPFYVKEYLQFTTFSLSALSIFVLSAYQMLLAFQLDFCMYGPLGIRDGIFPGF